jgi:hypothetical protein
MGNPQHRQEDLDLMTVEEVRGSFASAQPRSVPGLSKGTCRASS